MDSAEIDIGIEKAIRTLTIVYTTSRGVKTNPTTIPNQRILGNDEKFPSSSHRSAYSLIRFFSCLDNQHHFQEISSFSLLGFPCERNRFIKKDGILMTFDLSRNLP